MQKQSIFAHAMAQHIDVSRRTMESLEPSIAMVSERIVSALRAGGKAILFGNGGSAADAQHIAAELVARYTVDRPALAAIAITTDTSVLTAIANDWSVDRVYSRQIEAIGKPGDVAIGLSTSGLSSNVVDALKKARAAGLITVGFTGRDGGQIAGLVDYELRVPSHVTARIQEMHIFLGHVICAEVEHALFGIGAT